MRDHAKKCEQLEKRTQGIPQNPDDGKKPDLVGQKPSCGNTGNRRTSLQLTLAVRKVLSRSVLLIAWTSGPNDEERLYVDNLSKGRNPEGPAARPWLDTYVYEYA